MKRHFATYNSIVAAVIGGTGVARLSVELCDGSWDDNGATVPYLQRISSVSPNANEGGRGT